MMMMTFTLDFTPAARSGSRIRSSLAAATLAAATLTVLAAGCASDLAPAPGANPSEPPPPTVSTRMVEGAFETRVDATWEGTWVYFDFEQGAMGGQSEVSDPAASSAWDLGFQRFKVKSNGGVSGTGGVEVALVPDSALDQMENAPAAGWLLDKADGADGNMDPDFAFNQGDTWFEYDSSTHVLQPRRQVYVVMTAAGSFVGVQLLSYYDQAGTGGYLLFRWKKLQPPASPRVPATLTTSSAAP
jgi:hypothetical protein